MSVGVCHPASCSRTSDAIAHAIGARARTRPAPGDRRGDDHRSQGVPARERRVEGCDVERAVIKGGPRRDFLAQHFDGDARRRARPRAMREHANAIASGDEEGRGERDDVRRDRVAPSSSSSAGAARAPRAAPVRMWKLAPGIRWSTAHWSNACEHARGDQGGERRESAGEERGATPGHARAARAGTISKRAGVVPTCSPSSSIGRRSGASTATVRERSSSIFGCDEVRALVELRRGCDEVALRHVADQHDVEEAVVRLRLRCEHASRRRAIVHWPRSRRACVPRAVRRRAAPRRACSPTRRRRGRARRRTSPCRPAPSTSRSRAVRPQRSCRRCRHSRRSARPRRRSTRDTSRGRRRSSWPCPRAPYARHRRSASGSRTCGRSPCRCRAGSSRAPLRAGANEPVHDLVQRPVSADGDDELGAAACGLLGELDQMTGTLGEERRAVESELRGAVSELRPALARAAVAGRGIDEEDGAGVRHLSGA